jgi:hypothetical protein
VSIAALQLSLSLSNNLNFSAAHVMLQDSQSDTDGITEDQNDYFDCSHGAAIVDQTKIIHLPEVLRPYRFILGHSKKLTPPSFIRLKRRFIFLIFYYFIDIRGETS